MDISFETMRLRRESLASEDFRRRAGPSEGSLSLISPAMRQVSLSKLMIDHTDALVAKSPLTARDILAIEGLAAEERVAFLVKRVKVAGAVFRLEVEDGIFVAEGDGGRGVLPVWPTFEQAVRALFSPASTSWQGCAVVPVDLETLLGFLRQAAQMGDDFLVSPGPDFPGTVVPAKLLLEALGKSGAEAGRRR